MLKGAKCASTCTTSDAYCYPVGKHCFKPTNKGAVCQSRADCSGEEYCCPATKVCVLPDPQTVCDPSGQFPTTAAAGAAVAEADTAGSPDPDMDAFLRFAQTYNRNYHSEAEFHKRFGIFKKTLALIASRNAQGTLGRHNITQFADLELAEFKAQ